MLLFAAASFSWSSVFFIALPLSPFFFFYCLPPVAKARVYCRLLSNEITSHFSFTFSCSAQGCQPPCWHSASLFFLLITCCRHSAQLKLNQHSFPEMVSVDVNFFAGPIDRDAPLVSFGVFTGVFLPLVYLFWTRYVCNVAPPDAVLRKINTHSLHLGQPHQGAPVHPLGPAGPVHAGQHARVCLSSLSLSLSLSRAL